MKIKLIKLVNIINFYVVSWLLLVMMNFRSLMVERNFGKKTDCIGCYKNWVWSMDAEIMIFVFAFLYFAFVLKNYLARTILRILLVSFVLYFLIDLYIYKFLNHRFLILDIASYFNAEVITEIFNRDLGFSSGIIIILSSVALLLYLFFHNPLKFKVFDKLFLTVIFVLMSSLIILPKETTYIHSGSIQNIVRVNLHSKTSVDFTQTTIDDLTKIIPKVESLSCNNNGKNEKKNVILLVWESLSMYQSDLFSGLNNWTPNLDKIALENRYYNNFFANNFSSSSGRIALLTGEKSFSNIQILLHGKTRVGFWNTQRNLPRLFNEKGYSTSFLDGANLKFTKTGEYMQGIGFDYVEGHNYAGYNKEPRFGFNAVSDGVLLNRVLDFIKEEKEPFFTTVITVNSHPPFVNPETKKTSQEGVIKYIDNAVYDFYQQLEESNYFDDGILIIVSDHRSMTPVSIAESKKFGKQAVARIPLVVIDKSYKGEAETVEYLQQSDLLTSLQYLVSDEYCHRQGEGNIFTNPALASSCVFHNRGDLRDKIDVYCEEGKESGTIQLDGDNTRLVEGYLKNSREIIEIINVSRIAARKRHEEFFGVQNQ